MTTVGGALVYPRMKVILQLTWPADAESTHVCMVTIFKVHIYYVGGGGGAPMYAPPP